MSPIVKAVIEGKGRDLGGFSVRRVLPQLGHHSVGPFVFFDHLGPVVMPPGSGIDVRPHPHIGLATVTYLFDGELEHRDSLGTTQLIAPGDLNWMSAGKGIVHSERSRQAWRATGGPMHGLQLWVGLPQAQEDSAPAFYHHAAASLPEAVIDRVQLRVIAGQAYGQRSPVEIASPLIYVEARLPAGSSLRTPDGSQQLAIYVVTGGVRVASAQLAAGQMAILHDDAVCDMAAVSEARVVLIGGAPLDGPRYVYWNFVASSKERIEAAKSDWAAGRFPKIVGDDAKMPLPPE